MDAYTLVEVDGTANASTLSRFNAMCPETFPPLEPRHFTNGLWWLALLDAEPIGFAGMVPFEPFDRVGYFKRCYIMPGHHGHGLQLRLMAVRELRARQLGWSLLVSECGPDNQFSARNFMRAGFERCDPEQRWGAPHSLYWRKTL